MNIWLFYGGSYSLTRNKTKSSFNTIRINDGIELAREFYKKSCLYRYDERMRYNMKVSCILELAKKYVEFSEDTKAIM